MNEKNECVKGSDIYVSVKLVQLYNYRINKRELADKYDCAKI